MSAWWIIGPLDSLFVVLAIVLFTGKGGFLIAGYNTSSKEEQAKYDVKKLGRVMGALLLVVAALISLTLLVRNLAAAILFPGVITAVTLAAVLYANKGCKRNAPLPDRVEFSCLKAGRKAPGAHASGVAKAVIMLLITLIPAAAVSLFIYSMSRPPVYIVGDGALTIRSNYGETVPYADMQSIALKNSLPAGLSRKNGLDVGPVLKGYFSSKEGDAVVFVNTSDAPFLYIRTKDGWIVCNGQSAEKTRSLYAALKAKSGL